MHVRSPIVAVLGHVDHGKTSLLDSIRGSNVAKKEPGGITQMIGASYILKESIDELAKALKGKLNFPLKIPGLLFIDTPGHEAFTNLRERGGSIADIAILVVDVQQGFQPQTIESIKILKQFKTPFVIAANKIDLVNGWKSHGTTSFLESVALQPPHVQEKFDEKIYGLVGKISEYGFDSERFDRVTDFGKNIAIVPVSAKTKEGLSELLMLIAGLSQKFLEGTLEIEDSGKGKGSIIEVKEEKGMGTTIDVILYDGIIKKNDEIAFLTGNGVKRTTVRGLLEPNFNGKDKFKNLDEVAAAAGVKIYAPDLEDALPGSPIIVVGNFGEDKKEIEAQFKSVIIENNDVAGIVLRADSLGSVEAIVKLLRDEEIPIKEARVGKITKKDVLTAQAVATESRYFGAVLGFNVKILDEARETAGESGPPIIWSNIIYDLVDKYKAWVDEEKQKEKKEAIAKFPWPGKIKLLPGFCFRVSKPAVFGVQIIAGRVKKGYRLMNTNGQFVGEIRGIQHEKEDVDEATKGMQVAVSCDGITYGKEAGENDVLYVHMLGEDMKKWEKQMNLLDNDDKQLLEEIKAKLKKYF